MKCDEILFRRRSCIAHRHHTCRAVQRQNAVRSTVQRKNGKKNKQRQTVQSKHKKIQKDQVKKKTISNTGRLQRCPHCRKSFSDVTKLVAHVEEHERFQLQHAIPRTEIQPAHARSNSGSSRNQQEQFKCPNCPHLSFRDAASVVRHFESEHGMQPQQHNHQRRQQDRQESQSKKNGCVVC